MKRLIFIVPFAFLLSLMLPRCAIIVAPTGGPKDTIPPRMIRSTPPIYSTNFKRQKITLTFDEFIQLKELPQKLVLSPPQERLPEYRIRGKSLELSFFEPLNENTTYTLYLADAIADLNEGNPIENFEFAFSTGDEIDSLRFKGRVIDAFKLEPQQGILVMLYNRIEDSIPIKERPVYVTKTNRDGQFILSNLKKDDYKIFALKDGNANYLFDQITEEIGFTNDTIFRTMLTPPLGDSLVPASDESLVLWLFREENMAQSLTDFSRPSRRRLTLGFSRKPQGKVLMEPIDYTIDTTKPWYSIERNMNGDTISFWLLDNVINQVDSLSMMVSYLKTDSLLNLVETKDTLRLFYFERERQASRQRRKASEDEVEKPVTMPVSTSIAKGGAILPHESYSLTFNMPLMEMDTSLFWFESISDSIRINVSKPVLDSLSPRKYHIDYPWEHNTRFQFTAMPGAFTNLDSVKNDTLQIVFNGVNPDYFGTINLSLMGVEPNIIVELLNDRKAVVDSKITETDGIVKFTYVKPARYTIRFIVDANKNGKWDTGMYLKGVQPEKVIMFQEKGEITVHNIRANWEYDINFNLDHFK